MIANALKFLVVFIFLTWINSFARFSLTAILISRRHNTKSPGPGHGPSAPEARKRLRAPCNIDLIFSSNGTAGWIEMPLGKNFRRSQIFSLEISGFKVVLFCKFFVVPAGPGP